MKWKRRVWHFFILLVLSLDNISGRERSNPSGKTREGLKLKRLTLQKEQARFLRRLLFESSQLSKRRRGKSRQRWTHYDNPKDNWNDANQGFDDYSEPPHSRWQPNHSIFSQKPNGRKPTENAIEPFSAKSCCPQLTEIIEPDFGRNRSGHVVELYRDEKIQQRFYELICEEGIENEPCRFLQGRNQKLSKCTQQYVYTYALVESKQSSSGWCLDHIRMRSGCICKLQQQLNTTGKKNTKWETKR